MQLQVWLVLALHRTFSAKEQIRPIARLSSIMPETAPVQVLPISMLTQLPRAFLPPWTSPRLSLDGSTSPQVLLPSNSPAVMTPPGFYLARLIISLVKARTRAIELQLMTL